MQICFDSIRLSNCLDPGQEQHSVGPDLGPNCLQRLSEDDKNHGYQGTSSLVHLDPTVKPVLSGHSKRRPKLVFKTDYRLMQVKSIAECSMGSILQ